MEIKRVADHILVEINKKKFSIYWNHEYKFGENLVRRFFERITTSQLDTCYNAIQLMNKAIQSKTPLTKEEMQQCMDADKIIYGIVNLQALVEFAKVPADELKAFINACYPMAYKYGISSLIKSYQRRYIGIENEKELHLQDCLCLEDWCVTRALIARFIATDITSAYRFFLVSDGKKIIKDVMNKPTRLKMESFFIQMFTNEPCFHDLDKKSYSGELQDQFREKIRSIFKERHTWSKENTNPKEPSENTKKHMQLAQLIDGLRSKYPHKSLIEPRTEDYTKSDAERKEIVLKFFQDWDANLPDDIAFLKEQDELAKCIAAEKQEAIDKSDIEHTGKTQAQHKEDAQHLVMEVKDESGNVVQETPIA